MERDLKNGRFLPGNQVGKLKGKHQTPNILSMQDNGDFEYLADWASKKVRDNDDKFNTAVYLALIGKCSPVKNYPNQFKLGRTKTIQDIEAALDRVIQAEAAGKITHEEADAFEKRLATKFTYIQAAAHGSIQTISHLSTTEAFDILEKRNTEIKSLEKIN